MDGEGGGAGGLEFFSKMSLKTDTQFLKVIFNFYH